MDLLDWLVAHEGQRLLLESGPVTLWFTRTAWQRETRSLWTDGGAMLNFGQPEDENKIDSATLVDGTDQVWIDGPNGGLRITSLGAS